jgi:hypothetical protein
MRFSIIEQKYTITMLVRYTPKKRKAGKDFIVTTAHDVKFKFRDEIEIFECDEARERILEHPQCPFRQFAFWGECEIDLVWYYIAANGSVFNDGTQVILMEK